MIDIIPDQFYSPRKLVSMKILPWASSMTFNKRLKEEKWKDLFNPIVETKNNRTFTYILGANIIKVLEMAANGTLIITDEKESKVNKRKDKGNEKTL